MVLRIYAEGITLREPGPGGWATLVTYKGHERLLSYGNPLTTAEQMELQAVVEGLNTLTRPCEVEVITTSKYVVETFNSKRFYEWIIKNKHKLPNFYLWKKIYWLAGQHRISMVLLEGKDNRSINNKCRLVAEDEANKYT